MKLFAKGVAAVPAATAFLSPVRVWAQQPAEPNKYYDCGPSMMHWGGGYMAMAFGPIFMIVGLAIAIGLAIVVARAFLGPLSLDPSRHMPPGRAPLDILKERFARGEIDQEEYDRRRRVLGE